MFLKLWFQTVCILSLLCLGCSSNSFDGEQPKVINGEIDLSNWNFQRQGPVRLEGEWLFKWGQLLAPQSWDRLSLEMTQRAIVPARFKELTDIETPKQSNRGVGYASYAIKIKGLGSERVSLTLSDAFSASSLLVFRADDGKVYRVSNYGKVATRKSTELPKLWGTSILPLSFPGSDSKEGQRSTDLVILLHISSLNFPDGGIHQPVEIDLEDANNQKVEWKKLLQAFSFGVFLFIAIYHGMLYYQRPGDKAALFFSMFCLVLALRLFVMGLAQIVLPAGSLLAWANLLKLEYTTIPLSVISGSYYLSSLIPQRSLVYISRGLSISGLPLLLFIAITGPLYFVPLLWLVQAHALLTLIITAGSLLFLVFKRIAFAAPMLLAFFALSIGIINDLLLANGLIQSIYLGPYAAILFLLLQAGLIASNNLQAYKRADYLSETLSKEIDKETNRLTRVYKLSNEIQDALSLDDLLSNLKITLRTEYKIKNFALYLVTEKTNKLKVYTFTTSFPLERELYNRLLRNEISLDPRKTVHGSVFKRTKSLLLPHLKLSALDSVEKDNVGILKMQSIFIIPLVINRKTFAIFTLADSEKDQYRIIRDLSKSKRTELELLSKHLSAALYQSLQQTELEKSRQEITKQNQKLERMEMLSQKIAMESDFSYMLKAFQKTVFADYGLESVTVYTKTKEDLVLYEYFSEKNLPANIDLQFRGQSIATGDERSMHALVFKKGKSLFLKKLGDRSAGPAEDANRKLLNIESLFLVPMRRGGETFGVLSFTDIDPNLRVNPKANPVQDLSKSERNDIEKLVQLISNSLFQSLQQQLIESSQAEALNQSRRLANIQRLSQLIQNKSDLEEMNKNLSAVLQKEFNINSFLFYVHSKESHELIPHSLSTPEGTPGHVIEALSSIKIDLEDQKSVHSAIFHHKRPLFLKKIPKQRNSEPEEKIKAMLEMRSLFLIPLKMDDEVFGIFSLPDTKFQEQDSVGSLTKEQRKDLELLSEFVSSALYQALQKEQIQQAMSVVSRAKNEAAINQLAAHLAHEVNNPLNYIATGKTIQGEAFEKYHEMILGVLTGDDQESKAFKAELENLQAKFNQGVQQTNDGQDRIAKVIAEIRAITGVDGLNFSNFDVVPIINEEMVYSLHRNQVKSGEQSVKVTGTDEPIHVLSNSPILARSIRTVISNSIHFSREHKGKAGEISVDCFTEDKTLFINFGNNGHSIKNEVINDIFSLEKSYAYGTEQIGLAMIKELLLKINCDLALTDHGRESGQVMFQMKVPLE